MHSIQLKRFCFLLVVASLCLTWINSLSGMKVQEIAEASTVLTTGDFRLTAENKWDNSAKKNYAQLNWDEVSDLASMGYQLYQSEDGTSWKTISLKYNKPIKVLNIYPNVAASNTLKTWMDGLNLKTADGQKLIDVVPVSIANYNANPNAYLKNSVGEYQYDVLFFGSYDSNSGQDISAAAYTATEAFAQSGRGILFGHDTVISVRANFSKFAEKLGVSRNLVSTGNPPSGVWWTGSVQVKLINDGYLMKYPYEMQNGQVLTIPYAHNIEASKKSEGTTWMEFINPSGNWPNAIKDDGTWRTGWYLKTNDNFAMIQTGHSNGQSTLDERKIIANTLYNLAQVSFETNAQDYTVKDDVAPEITDVKLKCGSKDKFSVHLSAKDHGKKYQWYVAAQTKKSGTKKSDTVEEEIISDIQGYIYKVDNSATTVPAVATDAYGNVTNINAAVDLPNRTASVYGIDAKNNKYMHILAVDRANNVSQVKHVKLDSVEKYIDYEVERTADEAKIINLALDASVDKKMQSIEVQIPKNTEIKNFSSLSLPTGWFTYQNGDVDANTQSFGFAMTTTTNDLATMKNFLQGLRFTIKNPVNQSGNIRIILHEKILTSWEDHPDGKTHYYMYEPEMMTFPKAYNKAKKLSYKGLQGYLATITSAKEHDFIYNNIAKNSGWLGGTRAIKKDGIKVNDEASISENLDDYETALDKGKEWYWMNGPEKGLVFFTKPTYLLGGTAPSGVYQGFNNPLNGSTNVEPNGNFSEGRYENSLEFAWYGKTKYWNDISMDTFTTSPGYYIEFSEYGAQVEGEEDTDLCWIAPIPQKISIKGYDEAGNSLASMNQLFDQALTIGKTITVTPGTLPMYDFKELVDLSDAPHAFQYTVSDTFQEGKLVYANREVTVHVRQVVLDANPKVVLPKQGYGTIFSQQKANSGHVQDFAVVMGGDQGEASQTYTDYTIRSQATEPNYSFEAIVPQCYELKGYVMTTEKPVASTATEHLAANAQTALINVDVSKTPEFWLTVYMKPTTSAPAFYGWGYGQADAYEAKK